MTESKFSANTSPLSNRLMSRSGFPQDPNQRLPSFRNSLTKTSIIFQANPNLAKSQSLSKSSPKLEDRACGKDKKQIQPRNTNARITKVSKTSKYRIAKKLVQIESSVFSGFQARPISARTRANSSKSKEKDKSSNNVRTTVPSTPLVELKSEEDQVEEELLQDDFIDDPEGLERKVEYLPQSWESINKSETPLEKSERTRDSLFLRDKKESLVFFQLPKFFPTNVSKKIGKLRVWKSGKTEIICPSTGETFDAVIADRDLSSSEAIPFDDSLGQIIKPGISRELASYRSNTLTMLGNIGLEDMALLVPRVPPLKKSLPKTAPTKRKSHR